MRERYPDDLHALAGLARRTPPRAAARASPRSAAGSRPPATGCSPRYAGRTVLVVTHVTPIKTLVRLALGAPPESMFRMELSAASLSVVAYYADGNASLRLLNDTSYLL